MEKGVNPSTDSNSICSVEAEVWAAVLAARRYYIVVAGLHQSILMLFDY